MHLKIDKNSSGKYEIFLMCQDRTISGSTEEDFPFFGEYSEYSSERRAVGAVVKLGYLNRDVITSMVHTEDENESLKSSFVRKYNKQIKFYMDMINRIEKVGDWKKKVDNLKKMVDGLAQTIDKTALMFENEERVNPLPEQDVQQISVHETTDPYAKSLVMLKRKIKRFYKNLRRRFGDYAQGLQTTASSTSEDDIWAKEIVCEFAESACDGLGGDFAIRKIEKDADCYLVTISNGQDTICLSFGNNLMLRGIHPIGDTVKKFPHMSQKYYNSIWTPVVGSVGHFVFDENYVLVFEDPEDNTQMIGSSEDGYVKDCFSGFDVRDNSKISVHVKMTGSGVPEFKTCSIKVASNDRDYSKGKGVLSIENLRSFQMAKCIGTGTKYDGVAGKILHDEIIERNGYIEVPLLFKFDNGHSEKVFVSSKNVVPYI